jgi:hypothetical protein
MDDRNPPRGERWEELLWQQHRYNDRTVIKSGSYLHCYCPHCHASLIHDDMIRLETTNAEGEDGWLEMSPYLNVFEHRSNIKLTAGKEVADLRCPHCRHTLRLEGRHCERGEAHVACVLVAISTMKVPFYFCTRIGCHWHQIDPEDIHKIILDDSPEW